MIDRIRRTTLRPALQRFGLDWLPSGKILRSGPSQRVGYFPTGGSEIDGFEFPAGTPPDIAARSLREGLIIDSDCPDERFVRAAFERALMGVLEGPRDPIDIREKGKSIRARLEEVMRFIDGKLNAVLVGIFRKST